MKAKIITALIPALALFSAQAKEAYELVNDAQGYSYIQINQDVDSFSFISDFHSIGNSGKVGFFVYPDGMTGDKLKDYIATAADKDAQFGKHVNGGRVDLGALSAGDRVGFYLDRNNGDLVRGWDFQEKNDTMYIAFDKNGGHGKDEWMSVEGITYSATSGNTDPETPSGQPLPGALVMFALGGTGLGVLKFKKAKKA